MVKIIKKISLEVSKPNVIQAIVAKQYDNNSRFLQVTLIHEGKKIEIAPTSTVTINAKRTDGEEKSFAGEANNDGTATVPLTYWMLELEGEVWCDVSVVDTDGRKLSSTKFDLQVERASCSNGDITEDENYDVLIKLIEDVGKVTPDIKYDPTSEKAQSGIAVAEAIKQETSVFANAIKGSASGERVVIEDVSPIEHKAKVRVYGKNLFDISKIISNANITNNGDGTLTVQTTINSSGVSTEKTLKEIAPQLKVGDICIFSATSTGTSKMIYLSKWGSWVFNKAIEITQAMLESQVLFYASGVNTSAIVSNIQIEMGETATECTSYIDPTTVTVTEETTGATYTPNADGTCEIVSVSPTMTLLTDTNGVTIECEYNKDTNKVIGDIETALDSIIAMQNSLIGGAE